MYPKIRSHEVYSSVAFDVVVELSMCHHSLTLEHVSPAAGDSRTPRAHPPPRLPAPAAPSLFRS